MELELEILTRDEAQVKRAGMGRDEPNVNPHLLMPQLVMATSRLARNRSCVSSCNALRV